MWLLLHCEPYAWCEYIWDDAHLTIYWLSYDPRIQKDKIDCLCMWPWAELMEWSERYLPLRVVRLLYCWD